MQERSVNVYSNSNQIVEEAYRVLRANIKLRNQDKNIKTLALVSCNPSEGRSTVAINLAVFMAKAGMKVLFIDTDLRKPSSYKHLGMERGEGLTSILSGKLDIEECDFSTNIDNLYYIPSGPQKPNPSDMLISNSFTDLLEKVSEIYDIVILDTPPFGRVIDSVIVAAKSDGIIITAAYGQTELEKLLRLKEQMEMANANIIGIVLNKVSKRFFRKYFETDNKFHHSPKITKSKWTKQNEQRFSGGI